MAFLWNEKYYTGIDVIDKQHIAFLDLLNKMHDRYSNDADTTIGEDKKLHIYGDILKLREYALNHFFAEEKYMISNKYPKFFEHKNEHDTFIKKVFELEGKLFKDDSFNPRELIEFIVEWLKNHIIRIDRQFGEYTKRRNSGLEPT